MNAKKTRHQVRKDDKTQTSISLKKDVLDWVKSEAAKEDRTVSKWIERLAAEKKAAKEAEASGSTKPKQ